MLFKLINSSWLCESCGSELSFSVGRRTLVAIIGMAPILFQSFIFEVIQNIGLSKTESWILFIPIFAIWIIFIYSFDSFRMIKKAVNHD